jgi:cell division protein FtsW (lipid II flippase)
MKKLIGVLGVFAGMCGVYFLISGAIVSYSKVNLESSDFLLIGISLMFISQLLINLGAHKKEE